MADSEEILWAGETTPTASGVRALRRSFADFVASLPLAREVCEDLGVALAEIGINVASHAQGATWLRSELKRHDSDWTLVVADDGPPLMRDAGSFRDRVDRRPDPYQESGRGLYIIASRFPQHLYVPGSWRARGQNTTQRTAINRFIVRAVQPTANAAPRILIVDDDPVQRLTIEHYLRGTYRVIACDTAVEAELEAKLQVPDVIISDLHMPGVDGLSFRDHLSREPDLGLVPFLFLTSDRSPGASAAANEVGIDDLLYKPLDKKRLLSVLERLMKRQQQMKSLRQHEIAASTARFPSQVLPEKFGPYTLAARRISAGTAVNVNVAGGDLIWHRHTTTGFQLLLCDAMGHGLAAWPLAMANLGFVKGAALGMGADVGPGEFIAKMSDLLTDEGLLEGATLTALACWLAESGQVMLANAGQPFPFLVNRQGVQEIDVEGGLIGLVPGQSYETRQVTMNPGDRLVLITDGFVELADPDAASLAVESLKADLATLAGRPAGVIADGILRGHLMRSGGHSADDSMVCVIAFD